MIENFDSQRELQDDSVRFCVCGSIRLLLNYRHLFFVALAENIQQNYASAAH
jgi:hypothetical protein